MGIFDLFRRNRNQETESVEPPIGQAGDSYLTSLESTSTSPADYDSWSMPAGLDFDGVSISEFLQGHSNDHIREALLALPIQHLIFDDIENALQKNAVAVTVCLALADQLAAYGWRVKNRPDPERRADLPADEFKTLVVSPVIEALEAHTNQGKDVTPGISTFLRDTLARNLLGGEYPTDAKRLYEICLRQSYQPPAQREALLFWVYFCLYRIAFVSKNPKDIKAAVNASAAVPRPAIDESTFEGTMAWLTDPERGAG